MIARRWLLIGFTIVMALALAIMPLPGWVIWLRPEWVLLVLIAWVLLQPKLVGVVLAWGVGLLLDALTGTLLGAHALAFAITIYFVSKFQRRISLFPIRQQTLTVLMLTLLYQALLFWMQGLTGKLPHSWLYWSATLTSAILWSWLFLIVKDWNQRWLGLVES